jgi:hypothetical protein
MSWLILDRSPDGSPSPEEPSASPGSPYRVLAHESSRKLQPAEATPLLSADGAIDTLERNL